MQILEYAKNHPVQSGIIAVVGVVIFVVIVRGSGSGATTRAIYSGPSDAAFAADAAIKTAEKQSNATIQVATIGAGVQLNSDNKQAEVMMEQYRAAERVGIANANVGLEQAKALRDIGLASEATEQERLANEARLTNEAFARLGSLKKKDRDEALQAIVTRQAIPSGDNAANSASGIIGSIGGAVGSVAKAFKSIFSDDRLKENIRYLGVDDKGFGVYEFNYKGSNRKHTGRIAQDVERARPDLVTIDSKTGYKKIDAIETNVGKIKIPTLPAPARCGGFGQETVI
jgi:hypothetical protein